MACNEMQQERGQKTTKRLREGGLGRYEKDLQKGGGNKENTAQTATSTENLCVSLLKDARYVSR